MNDLAMMSWETSTEFSALSDAGRRKVRARCIAIERILKTDERRMNAIARESVALGMCGSALRRLISLYLRSGGDWRSQIDRRAEPIRDSGLPEEFKQFVKEMCEKNQRGSRSAFRKLRELYHSKATTYRHSKDGDVIELWPGYVDERGFHYRPEPSPRTGLPRGWTHGNLYRHHPTKAEREAARKGPIAASDLMPQVFSSRRNLKTGQYYVFDDRWLDLECAVPGMIKPVRSIELSAGDVFSGKTISWDLFPLEEVEGDDGRMKREQIKGVHMLMLLAHVLCVVGFHRDGVTLLVELGTAAISYELECLLCTLSGGRVEEINGKMIITKPGLIRVQRSGTKGGKSFGGGFPTLSKGNFRFKAGHESTHALKHTEMADLPGQVGKDMKKQPFEEQHGRHAHAVRTMAIAAAEPRPEVANYLRTLSGVLGFRQIYWLYDQTLKRIHAFRDHDLEGWREAGLETTEYRLKNEPDAWHPMAELASYPEAQRGAIDAFIRSTDWAIQNPKLSREEAWQKGADHLIRLPMHVVPQILGIALAKTRRVREDNLIQVDDKALGDDPMYFSSVARTPDNRMKPLSPNTEYRTWINPIAINTLFVADLEGRYIGTCKFERIDRGNDEQAQREFGRVAAEHAEIMREPLRRARRLNQQVTKDRAKQVVLFQGGPITDVERRLEADRKERARKAALQTVAASPVFSPAPASEPAADNDDMPDFGSWPKPQS